MDKMNECKIKSWCYCDWNFNETLEIRIKTYTVCSTDRPTDQHQSTASSHDFSCSVCATGVEMRSWLCLRLNCCIHTHVVGYCFFFSHSCLFGLRVLYLLRTRSKTVNGTYKQLQLHQIKLFKKWKRFFSRAQSWSYKNNCVSAECIWMQAWKWYLKSYIDKTCNWTKW